MYKQKFVQTAVAIMIVMLIGSLSMVAAQINDTVVSNETVVDNTANVTDTDPGEDDADNDTFETTVYQNTVNMTNASDMDNMTNASDMDDNETEGSDDDSVTNTALVASETNTNVGVATGIGNNVATNGGAANVNNNVNNNVNTVTVNTNSVQQVGLLESINERLGDIRILIAELLRVNLDENVTNSTNVTNMTSGASCPVNGLTVVTPSENEFTQGPNVTVVIAGQSVYDRIEASFDDPSNATGVHDPSEYVTLCEDCSSARFMYPFPWQGGQKIYARAFVNGTEQDATRFFVVSYPNATDPTLNWSWVNTLNNFSEKVEKNVNVTFVCNTNNTSTTSISGVNQTNMTNSTNTTVVNNVTTVISGTSVTDDDAIAVAIDRGVGWVLNDGDNSFARFAGLEHSFVNANETLWQGDVHHGVALVRFDDNTYRVIMDANASDEDTKVYTVEGNSALGVLTLEKRFDMGIFETWVGALNTNNQSFELGFAMIHREFPIEVEPDSGARVNVDGQSNTSFDASNPNFQQELEVIASANFNG